MTDRLMQSLGQVAREQNGRAAGDDRWPALCTGQLPAAEEEALRAQARTSESARRALEAFEPLGPEFRARVVRRLHRQIETEAKAAEGLGARDAAPGRAETGRAETDEPDAEAGPGEIEPEIRTAAAWWRWPAAAATAAAAAAAVIAVMLPRADPIPVYHLALHGGASSQRAAEPETEPRFVAGSPFELVLRPETAVSGPISVRTFIGHGPSLERWEVAPQISDQGSIRIAGTVGGEIRLESGRHVLSIVAGRRGKLPGAESLRDIPAGDLEPRRTRDWALVRLAVTVVEDP